MAEKLLNPNFYCPITHELMQDPVIDREGNSYEREAILAWLEKSHESPITRNPLNANDLVPNRSLRSSIEDYVAASVERSTVSELAAASSSGPIESSGMAEFSEPKLMLIRGNPRFDTATEHTYMVSIQSNEPDCLRRHPATICCVVDVSGSMCSEASVQGVESTGLSMLDIVKHAVKTVITTLGDNDRFGLVTFSTNSKVVCDLMYMTEAGKALAMSKVTALKTGGSTNLWAGLKDGMEILRLAGETVGNSGLFLLTDGVPSEIPPRGHVPMMQRYRDSNGGRYPATINTFGFGYALDSTLLSEIAIEGGGMYAFIPDSGFVGTAFVNALGNHLSSMGKQCVLSVEIEDGASISEVIIGNPEHTISSWGVAFKIPSLFAGTTQNFLFKVNEPRAGVRSALSVSLRYEHLVTDRADARRVHVQNKDLTMPAEHQRSAVFEDGEVSADDMVHSIDYDVHFLRLSLVDFLETIIKELNTAGVDIPLPTHQTKIAELITECNEVTGKIGNHARALRLSHGTDIKDLTAAVSGIRDDLKGQITEAVSKAEWYNRWGKHYLLSLQRAHLLQQCNNFKDPGIQRYGGSLFRYYRDKADDVFMSLPPPTPSRQVVSSMRRMDAGATASCVPPAPIDMSQFNDASGGCVHEGSIVHMADGSFKEMRHLVAGDMVSANVKDHMGTSCTARVACIVRTRCKNREASLVTLESGLRITPWHPVRGPDGHWTFPASLSANGGMRSIAGEFVYTFVLENVSEDNEMGRYGSSMIIDNMDCIALGHGIENDSVASHSFFGTTRVIESLRKCVGWDQGLVTLEQEDFIRDSVTGEVQTITQHTRSVL